MGLNIIVPVVIVLIVMPTVFVWARKRFKQGGESATIDAGSDPSRRLTSNALRSLPAPPWRVVYEVADDKLGGVEHVVIGPSGVFAVRTSMSALPEPISDPEPQALAAVAIMRGALDDALRRCAMTSDALVTVHWGVNADKKPASVEVMPGSHAVDGRKLEHWANGLGAGRLTPAQVDLAWQTVVTAIGRPDPLA
jgi:hypothetical protein